MRTDFTHAKSSERARRPRDRNHRRLRRDFPEALASNDWLPSLQLTVPSTPAKSDVPADTPTPAMRAPEKRFGSKFSAFRPIINQMPPHRVYIEPFLGWAAVMKAKLPADRNIGIDRDSDRIQSARLDIPSAELTIGDGIKFLEQFPWRGGELVYCDPPYLLATRKNNRPRYNFELSDHQKLLGILRGLKCPVILSGYESTLYAERLATWRVVTYQAMTRGGPATECLWCNFPEPLELHDYRWLGNGFRERERINRKKKRWAKKLAAMPPLERYAVFAAIKEVHDREAAGQSRLSSIHTSGEG